MRMQGRGFIRIRTMRRIGGEFDFAFVENVAECRPTASAVEFAVTAEQDVVAYHAFVCSRVGVVIVNARERSAKTEKH